MSGTHVRAALICDLCGLTFRGVSALSIHRRMPHTVRCPLCGAFCKPGSNGHSADVNAHLKAVHGRPSRVKGTLYTADTSEKIRQAVEQIEVLRALGRNRRTLDRKRLALNKLLHQRAIERAA
jgi:hypothetical protein